MKRIFILFILGFLGQLGVLAQGETTQLSLEVESQKTSIITFIEESHDVIKVAEKTATLNTDEIESGWFLNFLIYFLELDFQNYLNSTPPQNRIGISFSDFVRESSPLFNYIQNVNPFWANAILAIVEVDIDNISTKDDGSGFNKTNGIETILITEAKSFPNPFEGNTTIEYHLEKTEQVFVNIYDIKGSLVAQLVNGTEQASGKQQVIFEAAHLTEGMYFAHIQAGDQQSIVRMLLK